MEAINNSTSTSCLECACGENVFARNQACFKCGANRPRVRVGAPGESFHSLAHEGFSPSRIFGEMSAKVAEALWLGGSDSSSAQSKLPPTVNTSDVDGVRIVCISDTHNKHRDLQVPDGDILIHAGDFTLFGKVEHAHDFNEWLGTLPHKHKIVVNGNHENNADWKDLTPEILTNAIFLRQSGVEVEGLKIFGCEFFWPVAKDGVNAYYGQIPDDVSVIITHGPIQGYCDGGSGCRAMLRVVQKLAKQQLRLVVSGHVHQSHGVAQGTWMGGCSGVTFVNAANCGNRTIEFDAVVVSV